MLTTSQCETAPTAEADIAVLQTTVVEERRASTRLGRKLRIMLSATGWSKALGCIAEDISEGGLYLRIPATCGLSVGQRCEIDFGQDIESPELSGVAGEVCFATVVRTHVMTAGAGDLIGAGLRFDRPIFL